MKLGASTVLWAHLPVVPHPYVLRCHSFPTSAALKTFPGHCSGSQPKDTWLCAVCLLLQQMPLIKALLENSYLASYQFLLPRELKNLVP